MAGSQARLGMGTKLYRMTSASPETWQLIAERVSIGGPSMSRDAVDVTHMDSEDGFREFLPGLKDAGEITVEGNFIPEHESHNAETGLLSEFYRDLRNKWKIEFPLSDGATYWIFEGVMTGFELDMPLDDKLSFTATVKVSGSPEMNNG